MKRLISLLLVLILCVSVLAACGENDNYYAVPKSGSGSYDANSVYEQTPVTAPAIVPTEASRLSDSCDMVLASDYDNGDYYELVCNETETYQGITHEIGVIKNNEWLVDISSDNPMVSEKDILKKNYHVFYIGNSCFYAYHKQDYYYEAVIYNVNNASVYWINQGTDATGAILFDYHDSDMLIHKVREDDPYVIVDVVNYDFVRDFNHDHDFELTLLDTNTMQTTVIDCDKKEGGLHYDDMYVYPISEGIVAVAGSGSQYNTIAFYDLNGNVAFDTTEFSITNPRQNILFADGKCVFDIVNEVKTPFRITLDKQGNVIDSYKVEESMY